MPNLTKRLKSAEEKLEPLLRANKLKRSPPFVNFIIDTALNKDKNFYNKEERL